MAENILAKKQLYEIDDATERIEESIDTIKSVIPQAELDDILESIQKIYQNTEMIRGKLEA